VAALPRSFYGRPPAEVARALLGAILVHATPDGLLSGRIVEVEAYLGEVDPGSHAFRGPTTRNAVMFGEPGRLYVYRSYGIHTCANVVCDADGTAGAVLLRGLEPLTGRDIMRRHREGREDIANGPGRLCAALGITLKDNGLDLTGSRIWIEGGERPDAIGQTTRVGLTRGRELPLRFFVLGNPHVSRGRPS